MTRALELEPERARSVDAKKPVGSDEQLIIRPRRGWIGIDWRELYRSRELLYFLVWRDFKIRYKQTVLGIAWAVLQPIFITLVFVLVFGVLLKTPSDGHPHAIFFFAALAPWTFFSASVNLSGLSLVTQQQLLTKIYFPRLFVPTAAVGASLVDLVLSYGVFAIILAIYRVVPSWQIVFVPFLVVLTAMAALGMGYLLSALTVVAYRDFRYVVPFLLQGMMYTSPVIFPVSSVPEQYRWILGINPMAGIIDGHRSVFLHEQWNLSVLAVSTVMTIFLFVFGLYYFRKTERRFADVA